MNIYTSESLRTINYPVGQFIQENIPMINVMADKLNEVLATINKRPETFINLICTGSSGAIISALIAHKITNSRIIHIKKDGENSHSCSSVSSTHLYGNINVIVDDFIATGSTIQRINTKCKENWDEFTPDILCVTGYVRLNYLNGIKINHLICKETDEEE